ncbi:MAG: Clp protease N-terminal domain-containing protein, partial [Gammaproteobacteria bacterium]|nr:Clp protease N-terminal domain-containing protein [Gammaproteobacteria bacterium]
MRIDKLTSKLQSALADAQSLALGKEHNLIEPAHLLLALLEQKGGSVRPLLSQTGFNIGELRKQLQQLVDDLPQVPDNEGEITVSPALGKLLNQADKLAQQKGDTFISSETILLVAMKDTGPVGKLLNGFGVSAEALENAIVNLRGGESVDEAGAEDSWQVLQKYCIDLTERAENSELD